MKDKYIFQFGFDIPMYQTYMNIHPGVPTVTNSHQFDLRDYVLLLT